MVTSVSQVATNIVTIITEKWEAAKLAITEKLDAIKLFVSNGMAWILGIITNIMLTINAVWLATWTAIQVALAPIMTIIQAAIDLLKAKLDAVSLALVGPGGLKEAVNNAIIKIGEFATKIQTDIGDKIGSLRTWLTDMANWFGGIASSVWDIFNALGAFKRRLESIVIPSWFQGGSPSPMELWMRGIGDATWESGKAIDAFGKKVHRLKSEPPIGWLGGLVGGIQQTAHGLSRIDIEREKLNAIGFDIEKMGARILHFVNGRLVGATDPYLLPGPEGLPGTTGGKHIDPLPFVVPPLVRYLDSSRDLVETINRKIRQPLPPIVISSSGYSGRMVSRGRRYLDRGYYKQCG